MRVIAVQVVDILHLYRPSVPSMRAQTVQVVHTCHALAARGHRVTLLCDREPNCPETGEQVLAAWGLSPLESLNIELAPLRWRPGAGLWFRARAAAWGNRAGRDSIVYAREQKYTPLVQQDAPLVYEAHACEKWVAESENREAGPVEALERGVLARCKALVTNGRGTRDALLEAYGNLPARTYVIPNATAPDRVVPRTPSPVVTVGYAGSPRAYKGLQTVFESLSSWPEGVRLELVGGAPAGVHLPPNVTVVPTLPYAELPAKLATFHALLLPLDDNLFGCRLTNPLKLWDYLATGIPIIAADLPTVRDVAGERPHYYQPGNPKSVVESVVSALAAGSSEPLLRTWAQRAGEIETVLAEVLAARKPV